MDILIGLRHADYVEATGHITPEGYRALTLLAKTSLRPIVGGPDGVEVLTSPRPRAAESAEVVCDTLGLSQPVTCGRLFSAVSSDYNPHELLKLIQSQIARARVLILVTHLEYAQGFPQFFAEHVLGVRSGNAEVFRVLKGQAHILDCATGQRQVLPVTRAS